jgi:hypothetical protein
LPTLVSKDNPFICFPFVGDTVGGSHISAILLVSNLIRRGFNVVVALHIEGPLAEQLQSHEIPYVLLPRSAALFQARGQISKVRQILWGLTKGRAWLNARNIAIVHTNDGRMHRVWAPRTASTIPGTS